MRTLIVILFCAHFLALSASDPESRNLEWFDAKGAIENYRSSDGSKVRPKLVLFSHDWDLTSAGLRLQIVASLKGQPNNNPVLLDADCTDGHTSEYVKILQENELNTLPIIGVHDDKGWKFIDCHAEWQSHQGEPDFNWNQHLVELATSLTAN